MTTFKNIGLNPMILKAVEELGFNTPTPIQAKIIPHLLNSRNDVIALAQTGTGKTAAFGLPIAQQLDVNNRSIQAIVLCPTRELAIQVASDIKNFTKFMSQVSVTAVFGGERIDKQIRDIAQKPQIVVGTPGRVNDLIRRHVLKLGDIRWLVLDEADEMLNMGFKEELDDILQTMPKEKQVLLFSATMDKSIRRIADNYMNKPDDITAGEANKGSDNVEHFYYVVHEKDRYQALRRIADMNPDIHGIVFCRTRRETQQVADKLIQDHYSAEALHGEISQEQRTNVMNRFRAKKIQILVATDVAARGLDVSGLTHIINYNLPETMEAYVHRSGRTGRANNFGISLVIINMREQYIIRGLERKIGQSFTRGVIPTGDEICERQLLSLVDKVCEIEVNEKQIGKYTKFIEERLGSLTKEELIKKVVSVEFNKFLDYYKGAGNINTEGTYERTSGERNTRSDKSSFLFARFKINVGRNIGLGVKDLFQMLNREPKLKGVEIGNIDLGNDSIVFEVDERFKDEVTHSLEGLDISGHKVKVTFEQGGIQSSRDSGRQGARGYEGRRQERGWPRGGGPRGGGYSGGRPSSPRNNKNRF